jgi:hypothetical protein
MTVAVMPQHRGTAAGSVLYAALAQMGDKLGTQYYVTVLDEFAAAQLNKYDNGWPTYAPESVIPPKLYASRRPGSNLSLPRYCDVYDWKARLQASTDPKVHKAYNLFFGNMLHRRIPFTYLGI